MLLTHEKIASGIFSPLWEKKLSAENRGMTHLSIRFCIPKTSDTLKGSPTKIIGTEWQKISDRKSWNCLSSPSYP